MRKISSKAIGLSAFTALIVVGGGLISPARADWAKQAGTYTPMNLLVPTVSVSLAYRDSALRRELEARGTATAEQMFVWQDANGAAAPGSATVAHSLSTSGILSVDLSMFKVGGIFGLGTALVGFTDSSAGGGEKVSYKTMKANDGQAPKLTANDPVPTTLSQSHQVYSTFTFGPNGTTIYTLPARFSTAIRNNASISSFSDEDRLGTYNFYGGTIASGDSTAKTTSINVTP